MASPNGAPSTGFQTHRPKRGANNFVALAKKIAQDAGLREQMLAGTLSSPWLHSEVLEKYFTARDNAMTASHGPMLDIYFKELTLM